MELNDGFLRKNGVFYDQPKNHQVFKEDPVPLSCLYIRMRCAACVSHLGI
jgi:hypothetical protein